MDIKEYNTVYNDNNFVYYGDLIRSKKKEIHLFLKYINQSHSVLDIGCGAGWLTSELSNHAKEVVGIDLSQTMISIAKKRSTLLKNTNFIVENMNNFNHSKKYDVIILSNSVILENTGIDNHIKFLKNIYKHLEDNGLLLITMTPLIENKLNHNYHERFFEEHNFSISYKNKMDFINSYWHASIIIDDKEKNKIQNFDMTLDLMTRRELLLFLKISNFTISEEYEYCKESGFRFFSCKKVI